VATTVVGVGVLADFFPSFFGGVLLAVFLFITVAVAVTEVGPDGLLVVRWPPVGQGRLVGPGGLVEDEMPVDGIGVVRGPPVALGGLVDGVSVHGLPVRSGGPIVEGAYRLEIARSRVRVTSATP
jgi:hypothetical protein